MKAYQYRAVFPKAWKSERLQTANVTSRSLKVIGIGAIR